MRNKTIQAFNRLLKEIMIWVRRDNLLIITKTCILGCMIIFLNYGFFVCEGHTQSVIPSSTSDVLSVTPTPTFSTNKTLPHKSIYVLGQVIEKNTQTKLKPIDQWTKEDRDKFEADRAASKSRMMDMDKDPSPGHFYHPKKRKPEIKPDVPKNLKSENINGHAHLTWDAVPGVSTYFIYISEDGKNYTREKFPVGVKKNEITIGLLKDGQEYYFGVSAFTLGGESKTAYTKVKVSKKCSIK